MFKKKITRLSFSILAVPMIACSNQVQNTSPNTSEVQNYQNVVRTALVKLKAQSLFTPETDWEELTKITDQQIVEIRSEEDMKLPLTTALNALRDHHGKFIYKKEIFSHFSAWGTERERGNLQPIAGLVQKFEAEQKHEFEVIGETSGYIKIVGIGPNKDVIEEGQFIRNKIGSLASSGAVNWIVDLRYNTGGNMHPMLAGLGALFCDGPIGGVADGSGNNRTGWSMNAGNFVYGEDTFVKLPETKSVHCDARVAVLTSRYSASSGEAIATVFKGRPNTRFFGEPTAGYTTVTNWEHISDDMLMSISVSYYMDRTGVVYEKIIQPDVAMDFEPEAPLAEDDMVLAAQGWLKR